jgi:hypothetical protein
VSTNIDITQAKQLTSLVNSCVDISAYKPEWIELITRLYK